ncbi:MAG: glycosidase [FCB group bacterium]|nr:glycosidase [FCB group bacterium]
MKLRRLRSDPVLLPDKENAWESAAVFNAAVIQHDHYFHMIYRATNLGGHEKYGRYINSLGYARSNDLIHWERYQEPILINDVPQESRGPEDPRIVKIENEFYMVYTGFGGRFDGDYRISLATSRDLIHWERQGILLDEPNKDASLFPEKISGRYGLFHRRPPDIWICFSDDLKTWTDHQKIMSPVPESWEQERIGIAGPPLRIDEGWLLIYHGVDATNCYRLGMALLDYQDPSVILARYPNPILEPELDWERNGFIPNVVFSCATLLDNNRIYCPYGGADTVMGMAYIDSNDIRF